MSKTAPRITAVTKTESAVYAAGAICWRLIDGRLHILVIHRTAYGDVTIPKGKVDPGESLPQTAVREIEEETGLRIDLGVPLGVSNYPLPSGRRKVVHYWAAEVSDTAVRNSSFRPNSEVAAIEWVTPKRARRALSYEPDIEILDAFTALVDEGVLSTFPIIVLRHAKALGRSAWHGDDDSSRPLTEHGVAQAAALVPTLQAWGPKRLVSSSAVRCVTTLAPLSAELGRTMQRRDELSQTSWTEGDGSIRRIVGKRVRSGKPSVLCTHRPVLPEVFRELSLATGTPAGDYLEDAAYLEPAGFSVVHFSQSNPASGIIAVETHAPRD